MDKWDFGFTMMIVGIGGTFLTLWVLSLVVTAMKKIYPLAAQESKPENKS